MTHNYGVLQLILLPYKKTCNVSYVSANLSHIMINLYTYTLYMCGYICGLISHNHVIPLDEISIISHNHVIRLDEI